MLAYHRTANLHWLLHMVNDHCAFISIFAVPNFTSNVFFSLQPTKDTENIYLGPHGAPPSRGKKPEDISATTGYRDKNSKVREGDQKAFGSGRNSKGGNAGDFLRHHNGANHAKDPFKRAA